MLARLFSGFIVWFTLTLTSMQAYAINWDNLDAMRGKLQSMTETQQSVVASYSGTSSPYLDTYRSYIDRLRLISNQVNDALLAKNQGNYQLAESKLADACREMSWLLGDIDRVRGYHDLSHELRDQFQALRDDVQIVIDGIGCSAGGSYYEGRTIQSSYRGPDGRSYDASLSFQGQQGSYRTSSFTGTFSNVRYSDGGKKLEANWSANGQGGWVTFWMYDTNQKRFSGNWGYHGDQHARGEWKSRD